MTPEAEAALLLAGSLVEHGRTKEGLAFLWAVRNCPTSVAQCVELGPDELREVLEHLPEGEELTAAERALVEEALERRPA